VLTAVILGLSAIVIYFGKRWHRARAEVLELQAQNALLRRRLARSAR
jgi:hypothetical protein